MGTVAGRTLRWDVVVPAGFPPGLKCQPHLLLGSHRHGGVAAEPWCHRCPPPREGGSPVSASHTHRFHQAVCAPLLVTVFVPEAAGDGQAGWCESPIGDVGLICVPGTAVQGWQAAVDLVQRL